MRSRFITGCAALGLVVAACGGGGTGATSAPTTASAPASASVPASAGGTMEVPIATGTGSNLVFVPATVTVPAGSSVHVTFTNKADLPHNLTFSDPIGKATSTVVAPGSTESVEFTAPGAGDYAFACTIHPGMGGTLVVEPG